jgi:hypothetical protein
MNEAHHNSTVTIISHRSISNLKGYSVLAGRATNGTEQLPTMGGNARFASFFGQEWKQCHHVEMFSALAPGVLSHRPLPDTREPLGYMSSQRHWPIVPTSSSNSKKFIVFSWCYVCLGSSSRHFGCVDFFLFEVVRLMITTVLMYWMRVERS